MRALLDGDIITYRSGFAAQHMRYIYDGVEFENYAKLRDFLGSVGMEMKEVQDEIERKLDVEPVENALANVKSIVRTILDEVDANDYTIFLSTGYNYRGDIATIRKYKGNRDGAAKPEHYDAIHEYLMNHYNAVRTESIEADDAMAMCQTQKTVICSLDKDMLQVPGFHYNWVNDEKLFVNASIGMQKLFMQVLTGDSTDNIPGIYGIGPVKAYRITRVPDEDLWDVCINAWEEYLPNAKWCRFDNGVAYYAPWFDPEQEISRHPSEIVEEVYNLLLVGGEKANAALQESGEQVPLPSEKEREKAWATRALPELAGGGHSARPEEEEGEVRVRGGEDSVRGTSTGEDVHTGPDTGEGADVHRDQGQVHCAGS
jgi:hypothetical protein